MRRALCILVLSLVEACTDSSTKSAENVQPDKANELPSGERRELASTHDEHDEAAIDKRGTSTVPPTPVPKPRGTFQRAPERSCALIARESITAPEGHATLTAHGDSLHMWLGYRDNGAHQLARLSVPDGAIEASTSLPTAALSAPAVSNDGHGGFHVAVLLAPHAASWAHFAADGKAEIKQLTREVDTRFRPAISKAADNVLIAYTRPVKTAMHVEVARIANGEVTTQDVTPISHGGSAPVFVLGAKSPTLVMIDARAGVSPLLEVPFDNQGQAGAAIVRTPVSQPYGPTELWAVDIAELGVEVAFTAIGKAAATAIGRVPLRKADQPVPLLPSLGYGQLHMAAVLGARRAVFVLQSPIEARGNPPLNLELVVIDAKGEGPRLKLDGLTTSAAPSLVALETPGQFALLHRTSKAWELVRLVCDA